MKNINYPHPVLSVENNDYKECSFNVLITEELQFEGNFGTIKVSYELTSKGLNELIKNDKAHVLVYLECVPTQYRKTFSFEKDKRELEIDLKKSELSGLLELKCYVIAKEQIKGFSLEEHNKEVFGNIPFNIDEGNILAVAEYGYRIPLENYDPLKDRPSIFCIRRNLENEEEIAIDYLTDHKVAILLSDELLEKYKHAYEAPEIRTTLVSMFAAAALTDVLAYIKNSSQDDIDAISEFKWYQIICSRLEELGIDIKEEPSMVNVTNKVLPHIFGSAIESISTIYEELNVDRGE